MGAPEVSKPSRQTALIVALAVLAVLVAIVAFLWLNSSAGSKDGTRGDPPDTVINGTPPDRHQLRQETN
jgi:hypothetical protein